MTCTAGERLTQLGDCSNQDSQTEPVVTPSQDRQQITSQSKPYICVTCDKHYSKKAYLNRHIKERHIHKKVQCDTCGQQFTRLPYLQKHLIEKHQQSYQFKCYSCDFTTSCSKDLTKHKQDKHNNKFSCPTCARVLSSNHSLKAHRFLHT